MPKNNARNISVRTNPFALIKGPFPYRAREDQTALNPNVLLAPSQNVVNNTAGRLALVKGYSLDGASSAVIDSGILSNFDFTNFKGDVRNLRCGFLTNAGNDGKLQYRYITGTSTVNWVTLKSALTNVRLSYCEYWDNVALVKLCLWVDGSNNVFAWNGAVTTMASATVNTVTKNGTTTWAQEGFATAGTRSIVINGQSATYTGGEGTTTLTGVSFDFSAQAAGSIANQDVVTVGLGAMTSILATFGPTVIGCGRNNQVYLGASNSNSLYISKVNDYTNYAFTSPVRVAGEGDLIPLDAPPVKFVSQEVHGDESSYDMWISEGTSVWSVIRLTLDSTNAKESMQHIRMKVAPLQGAKSERLVSRVKNHIVFVGNDNVVNTIGYMSYQYVPILTDISYPIIDDMNSYDMTDGSIFYHRNYIYVAVPKSGLIRIYNMTDQTKEQYSVYNPVEEINADQPFFWEAPVGYPISGFYVVNGVLYGHSYATSESYKLFDTGSFNGQDITGNATLAFDDKGDRGVSKMSAGLWVEGYIKQNTVLQCGVSGDLNSFRTTQVVTVNGNDNTIVAYGGGGNTLGDSPLGVQPLGGASIISSSLPAWFHVIKTYPPVPSYLEQLTFATKGVDLQWELITFGTDAADTKEGNNSITQ